MTVNEWDYTNPLDRHLLGNRNLKFLNGQVLSVNITHVIVNGSGDPVVLVDSENVSYNWGAIMEVKENLWMSPPDGK